MVDTPAAVAVRETDAVLTVLVKRLLACKITSAAGNPPGGVIDGKEASSPCDGRAASLWSSSEGEDNTRGASARCAPACAEAL